MKITVKRLPNGDIQLSDGAMGLVMSKDDAFDMAGEILAYDRERAFIRAMDEHSFDDPPTKTVTAPRTCSTCRHFCPAKSQITWKHDVFGKVSGGDGVTVPSTCHRNPPPWQSVKESDHCGEWGAK